jgi:DNA-binding NarL/FixJ family response regulator
MDHEPGPSVLVVDDDADVRLAIRLTLEWAPARYRVVAEAASGEDAILRWRELRPDFVVLDAQLPAMSGLDAARSILAEAPAQAIVLCTGMVDDTLRQAASALGVRAVLLKTALNSLPDLLK